MSDEFSRYWRRRTRPYLAILPIWFFKMPEIAHFDLFSSHRHIYLMTKKRALQRLRLDISLIDLISHLFHILCLLRISRRAMFLLLLIESAQLSSHISQHNSPPPQHDSLMIDETCFQATRHDDRRQQCKKRWYFIEVITMPAYLSCRNSQAHSPRILLLNHSPRNSAPAT